MRERIYYVYIMASRKNGTMYIGVTNNLERGVFEHKSKMIKGFSSFYDTDVLVYYEQTNDVGSALDREKHLKAWKRAWKIKLIEENNPNWEEVSLR